MVETAVVGSDSSADNSGGSSFHAHDGDELSCSRGVLCYRLRHQTRGAIIIVELVVTAIPDESRALAAVVVLAAMVVVCVRAHDDDELRCY